MEIFEICFTKSQTLKFAALKNKYEFSTFGGAVND